MTENLKDGAEWGVLPIRIPPELRGYEPEMQKFFDAMVFKLRRNAHKGKWETLPMALAMDRLNDENGELAAAVSNGSTMEILMEAADVANMALIVANISLEVREEGITLWAPTARGEKWHIGRMRRGQIELHGGPELVSYAYTDHQTAQNRADELNAKG